MQIMFRWLDKDFQIMKMNINRPQNEIIAPIDDRIFHVIYVSG